MKPAATCSAIIITKNEEANIRECLQSVKWMKDLVVIDAGSTDKTVAIARKFTAKTFTKPWQGFGAARNLAIGKCSGDWIFWIDADERMTPALAEEIRGILSNGSQSYNGFSVPRRSFFLGKWIKYCGWYPGRVVRLFRRGTGRFSDHKVHERIEITGKVGRLQSDLLHYTDPSLSHYFEKFNRYTTLAADEMTRRNYRWWPLHLFLRPLWTFIRMYVLQRGFLDGMHGFVLSANSAFYVLTKYAKVWEHSKR